MWKKFWFLVCGNVCLSLVLFAQQGRVVGTVSESGATETIIGVNVMAEGENAGTNTDFAGDYVLGLNPGTYTITYSFLGFQTQAMEGVVVMSGEANQVDVTMEDIQEDRMTVV